MKHARVLGPALLVVTCVALAAVVAAPAEPQEQAVTISGEPTAEEKARQENFVERFREAQRLMGSGKDERAEKLLRELIAEEPEAAPVHHALAIVLRYRGRADEASATFAEAARLAPEEAVIHRDAGMDLLQRGAPKKAEPYLARARKLWPEDIEAAVGHGRALRSLGRVEDAKEAYARAMEIQKESVDARVGSRLWRVLR